MTDVGRLNVDYSKWALHSTPVKRFQGLSRGPWGTPFIIAPSVEDGEVSQAACLPGWRACARNSHAFQTEEDPKNPAFPAVSKAKGWSRSLMTVDDGDLFVDHLKVLIRDGCSPPSTWVCASGFLVNGVKEPLCELPELSRRRLALLLQPHVVLSEVLHLLL